MTSKNKNTNASTRITAAYLRTLYKRHPAGKGYQSFRNFVGQRYAGTCERHLFTTACQRILTGQKSQRVR